MTITVISSNVEDAMEAKIPLTFRIYRGDQLLREETLTQDIIKIRKLESAHLRIDDEAVSRMHGVIEVTGPNEIHIIDLGSSSGTVVNGQKVNKCAIQDGDELVLGGTRITVAVGEATTAEAAAGPPAIPSAPAPFIPPGVGAPMVAGVPGLAPGIPAVPGGVPPVCDMLNSTKACFC